jgi:hypothetical protein
MHIKNLTFYCTHIVSGNVAVNDIQDIDLIKRIQHYIDYIVTVNDL